MSNEEIPDDDSRKLFKIISNVDEVDFHRPDNGPSVDINIRGIGWQTEWIKGNVYIMNDQGKTIQTFGCAPFPYNKD